jgi:hypothetical protein
VVTRASGSTHLFGALLGSEKDLAATMVLETVSIPYVWREKMKSDVAHVPNSSLLRVDGACIKPSQTNLENGKLECSLV